MPIDWTKIYKKYNGKWVALKNDEVTVIAHGKTAKEALQKAKETGYSDPILTRIPQRLESYIGTL